MVSDSGTYDRPGSSQNAQASHIVNRMPRTVAIVMALLVAACAPADAPSAESSSAITTSNSAPAIEVEANPEPTTGSTTPTEPDPPNSEVSSTTPPSQDVRESLDLLGYQRARPGVSTSAEPRWAIESVGFALRSAVADDDTVVYSTIAAGNIHQVFAVDRQTGDSLWTLERGDKQVRSLELLNDVVVIDWSWSDGDAVGFNDPTETQGYTVSSGEELWTIPDAYRSDATQSSATHLVRRFPNTFHHSVIDVQSGEIVGTYFPVGDSLTGFVSSRDSALVVVDQNTAEPIDQPTPVEGPFGLQSSLVAVGNKIVFPDFRFGELFVLDRDTQNGSVVEVPETQLWSIVPVRADSDVVVIQVLDEVFALDAVTLERIWNNQGSLVRRFGDVGGEVHGLIQRDTNSVFVSLETGQVRCDFGGAEPPEFLRDGFVIGGSIYDTECEQIHSLGNDDFTVVDRGILTTERLDETIRITLRQ